MPDFGPHVVHQIPDRDERYLVGDGDVEAGFQLQDDVYDVEQIELQLAHKEKNAVSAAYNHATYLPQRAKMMQFWADYLDALRTGASVVRLAAE